MRSFTFRRLEVFLAVAETGSFAAAADLLDMAQPSVSNHIRGLEKHVGGLVFERKRGRKPMLTELGSSVLVHARELLAEANELSTDATSLRNNEGRRVVFSCQRSLANFILKDKITEFALTNSDVHLVLRIGTQEDVLNELRNGTADLGCFLSNDNPRGMTSEVIGSERLLLVCAPTHPLARRRKVSAAEIRKHKFVGAAQASMFGRAVVRQLAAAGITELSFVAQVTEYQFLRELVAAGVGIACSPESSVGRDIAEGTLRRIDFDGPELKLDIRLTATTHRAPNPSTRALSDFLGPARP